MNTDKTISAGAPGDKRGTSCELARAVRENGAPAFADWGVWGVTTLTLSLGVGFWIQLLWPAVAEWGWRIFGRLL